VSPRGVDLSPLPVPGTGPRGKIQITDIREKLNQIRGDVEETAEEAKPIATYAAVAGVIVLVAAAFWLGRKRGQRRATWVEIRRL
jgi:pyruvate/2-oxoglutarate dehydrogenase complex dihydrolipoamide acyltransferase (E2) component